MNSNISFNRNVPKQVFQQLSLPQLELSKQQKIVIIQIIILRLYYITAVMITSVVTLKTLSLHVR